MAEKVLSIEIGPNLTKVAEVERKSVKVIHNAFYFETPEGTLENGMVTCNPQFQLRLEEGLKSKGIRTKKVIFVLQASNIGNKEEVMPQMKDAKIREYIETNAGTFFPTSGEGYTFVYRNNGKTDKDQMRAQLFAVPKNMIKAYEDLANFCKLTLVDIELVENGIAKAIREFYPLGIVASIDVESVCTYLTIVKNGEIMMQRMIPFGIDESLKALQESGLAGADLKFDEVFKYTTEHTCFRKHFDEVDEDDDYDYGRGSDDDDSASGEIKDTATDEVRFIVGNLSRFLDFYKSHHQEDEIDKIIVSGLAAYCKGFPELLANELSQELIAADSTLVRDIANKKGIPNVGIFLSTLYAAANADNTIIDKNAKSGKGKDRKLGKSSLVRADDDFSVAKKVLIAAIIVGVLFIGAGAGLYFFFNYRVSDLKTDISKLQEAKNIADNLAKSKANYEAASEVDKLSEVANDDFMTLLNELESALPSDVVITSIDANNDAVTFEVQSASKQSIAALLSSVRNFSTVDLEDTIDISASSGDSNNTTASTYTTSVKCAYKRTHPGDSTNSTSSSSSSSSSTSSNSTSSNSSSTSNSSKSSSNSSTNKTN